MPIASRAAMPIFFADYAESIATTAILYNGRTVQAAEKAQPIFLRLPLILSISIRITAVRANDARAYFSPIS